MARPKTVDRSAAPRVEKTMINELLGKTTTQVLKLLRHMIDGEKITDTEWARRTGLTQSTVSDTFAGNRGLTFNFVGAACVYFDVSVGKLFSLAEDYANHGDRVTRIIFARRGTEKQTKARLQRLLWATMGYDPDKVRDASERALCELACSVAQLENGVPEFCRMYYSGRLSDDDVLAAFDHAIEESHRPEKLGPNDPPLPLWAALKEHWIKPASAE